VVAGARRSPCRTATTTGRSATIPTQLRARPAARRSALRPDLASATRTRRATTRRSRRTGTLRG
jgi:hypothetical protein